ncbi:ATP-binding cassette domain-containing protein [Oceanicola sp. 502str15]|uniref:ATP-binding cassette domain-containing protein n=1 Tax=Oceanicola sp. 502str15 TaxID=2696061 RepID=UPI002094BAA0|nr:sugar ABC transporter ATP-binding protein [Oceanicola sp. 502str15]MCO6384309.1 ATP-binding cassette domain-containing protein [Oceanicola sp. 502str15]
MLPDEELPDQGGPLVRVTDARKTYGPTVALKGVTMEVRCGEVLGIVGHNGAGKSTLMRALSGLERPTAGSIEIDGQTTPGARGFAGVRMAYQEGSLAAELTVRDNIAFSSAPWLPRWRWHRTAARRAGERLQEIFPGNDIRAGDFIDDLQLASRQMVEIARATLTDDLRLLILDEPTESLSGGAVDDLYDYVRKLRARGLGVILVSHRLREILGVCDRVIVLKDGAVASTHRAGEVTERDLFMAMGGEVVVTETGAEATGRAAEDTGPVTVRVPMKTVDRAPAEIMARRGEVIGLAGIAGQGQEQVLERLWRGRAGDVQVEKARAYLPGDRQRSGIFPLWSVARNLSITALGSLARNGIRQQEAERALVDRWVDHLKVRGGAKAAITGLSGGNQQKVIVARAFASQADTILLDDPFRGVDIHTKSELYQLIREEAAGGRTIIWYSSENSEMRYCDRAYVLRAGQIAGVLHGREISDERIIALSFAEASEDAA